MLTSLFDASLEMAMLAAADDDGSVFIRFFVDGMADEHECVLLVM